MIDFEASPETGINVWIGFADLLAGLLLTVVMGLGIVLHEHIKPNEEDVQFSNNLIQEMNEATRINDQMKKKLGQLLPGIWEQALSSETEIIIPAEALFGSGEYDVSDPSKQRFLAAIRQALQGALDEAGEERRFLRVTIQGHTDSDPIKSTAMSRAIPTNWELSSRRATGVLRFFEQEGLNATEYNVVAMGLANTMPVINGNTNEDKKRNRRIVIRIEPDLDKIRASLKAKKPG